MATATHARRVVRLYKYTKITQQRVGGEARAVGRVGRSGEVGVGEAY